MSPCPGFLANVLIWVSWEDGDAAFKTSLWKHVYNAVDTMFLYMLDLQYIGPTEQDPRLISLQWNQAQQSKPVFGTESCTNQECH